jgi:endonuclease-3
MVVERFGGRVPRTMEELVELPGVARKTANIILSNAYGVIEGVAVDTHVKRLSQRLGLTKNEDPVKIERDLMEMTPRKHWADLSHLLIFHGRKICVARKPRHGECVLFAPQTASDSPNRQ